jgi:hypothetical protein
MIRKDFSKILRKIYGPTQNPDGTWRIKTNDELRHRMKQDDIIKFIKSQRLRWVAHVMRMENTKTTREITEWMPYKTRPAGRPRLNFRRLMSTIVDVPLR